MITVNSLETEERQRFTICHEIAHIVLALESSHEEVPSRVLCEAASERNRMRHFRRRVADAVSAMAIACAQGRTFAGADPGHGGAFQHIISRRCVAVRLPQRHPLRLRHHGARCSALRGTLHQFATGWGLDISQSAIPVGSVAHRLRSSGSSAADTDEVAQDIWFDNWEKGLDLGNSPGTTHVLTPRPRCSGSTATIYLRSK